MGFFSELKEDLSQAVNELLPNEEETPEEGVLEAAEGQAEAMNVMQEEAPAVPSDAKSLEEMLESMDTEELFAGIKEEAGEDFFDEEDELPELEAGSYFSQTLKEAVLEQMGAVETAVQESVPEAAEKIEDAETFEEPQEESLEDFLAAALAKLPQEQEEILQIPEEEAEGAVFDETAEAVLPEISTETETAERKTAGEETVESAEEPEKASEEMNRVLSEDGNLSTDSSTEAADGIGSLQEAVQVMEEKEENEENTNMNMDMLPEEGMLGEETVLEMNENTITEEIGGFNMDTQLENKTAVDETAVITAGMTINGDMVSEGSVEVIGNVIGNIEILGKLNITGSIQGNSKAAEVYAENAKITGEISSEGSVKIGQSSVIIGNISATSAVIAGAVKGDIDVHGPVILDTSAIVMGNIKSKSVQINNGAVIEGMCSQCYADVNPTSFFEDFKKSKNK